MQSELLEQVKAYFMALQDTICQGLEQADGNAKFVEDSWQRAEGGGGRTRESRRRSSDGGERRECS